MTSKLLQLVRAKEALRGAKSLNLETAISNVEKTAKSCF